MTGRILLLVLLKVQVSQGPLFRSSDWVATRGCHDLRSSSSRTQLVRNAQCPCCESRESETIQHTLFECEAFEEEREVFLSRLYSVCPLARQLNDEYRCRLVMGAKLPREIENPLYRYLIAISKLRLGILTEQGEGS